jgi:hypothetical protein
MREASNPKAARPRADVVHEGCGPTHVDLGIGRRLKFGEQRRGETSRAVEVAAFEVIWVGAAVVHLGPCVRQRREAGTGLGGERVLATVTRPVQAPNLSIGPFLRQCLQHGENGSGTNSGADQQHGRVRLIEDERAAWCRNVELVADSETCVQVSAGGAIVFTLDGDSVVVRSGWSRESE